MQYCQFCKREAKTNVSNAQHELYCKQNPNKKQKIPSYGMLGKQGAGSNQYLKAKKLGLPIPLMTDLTRSKISKSSQERQIIDEQRAARSVAMKQAVINNPESYSSANRGRVKQIIIDGIIFQGQWEVDFYMWCKESGIKVERCIEWFSYEWNGSRKYNPDFFLPELSVYIEVKGYETERDRAKWEHFPKRLAIVKKDAILMIRKKLFEIKNLSYHKKV